MHQHWIRRAALAAGAVATYALAGFAGVPWLLQSQLPRLSAEHLKRPAAVDAVQFNPFTLRLQMQGLRLQETDGSPLLALDALHLRMQWRSLVQGAWRFEDLHLVAPRVHLIVEPDGTLNLARLAASLPASEAPAQGAAPLPRFVIEHFTLARGRVDFDDRQAGYKNVFTPIDLDAKGLSTLVNAHGQPVLSVESSTGARLHWEGDVSLNPVTARGTLRLENADLSAYNAYLKPFTPLVVSSGRLGVSLPHQLSYAQGQLQARVEGGQLSVDQLALAREGEPQAFATLPALRVEGLDADLARRELSASTLRLQGGHLRVRRGADGELDIAQLTRAAPAPARAASSASSAPAASAQATPAGLAWSAGVRRVELSRWTVDVQDQATGIALQLLDLDLGLDGVSSHTKQPVVFEGGLRLASGGRATLRGRAVATTGRVDAALRIDQFALAPLQPLLAQHVRLKLTSGTVSTQGQLQVGPAAASAPTPLRYDGSFEVTGLALQDEDSKPFLSWKQVVAPAFSLRLAPGRLEVPELRIVEPKAILILESDRSFNAARLLVKAPAARAASSVVPPAGAEEAFALRMPRVRLQGAQVFFEDRSLRPQFGAEIHQLNGVITGLSSRADARSQFELDGQVGEFGLARVRGGLNPFAPRDNTDLGVTFRNVDMVPTSPYAMKFAGYRIAQGKLSLDLRYRVRDGKLDSQNRIVLDSLTLGERVDSPDALKLPLALALAILRDSNGRIDLDLPITGDLDNPQFSYGAIVWKAIGNVLTQVVTAPFRALGAMLGVSGDALEEIAFDPGSARLLPPEREKLQQLADILAKRASLRVVIPGVWHEAADGAALRAVAVRSDVARRAGIRLDAGDTVGPLDLADGKIRSALRAMFTARFGSPALEQVRQEAEAAAAASGAAKSPAWQQAIQLVQGEPRVSDLRGFYRTLRQRLEQAHTLPPQALAQLGNERAQAVAAALAAMGVEAARVATAAPAATTDAMERSVPLKLALAVSR